MSPTVCAECGAKAFEAFKNAALPLGSGGQVEGLCGVRCTCCGQVYLDKASHARYAQASDEAVHAARTAHSQMLRRVRKKLGLTQHQAAELTGGGHNAFSRYERGQAQPMPAVVNLFKLLDRRPELLAELRS